MVIFNTNNLATADLHSNKQLNSIQRQQYSTRQSKVLTMKTINLLYTELNQPSINNNHQHKIKQNLHRQLPILIRRHYPKLENLFLHQQPSDVNGVFGNQLQPTLPSQSTFRNKSSRRFSLNQKSLNYSKTISESTIKHNTYNTKLLHPLQIPIWTPVLQEKEITHTRILRSKTHLLKHSSNHNHQLKQGKINLNGKQISIPELYITSRSTNHHLEILNKTNIKDLIDECKWDDPESSIAVLSDSAESVTVHCDSPMSIQNPQINIQKFDSTLISDQQSLSSSSSNDNSELKPVKIMNLRPYPYITPLPPVVEHANDEEIYNDTC
ncbi:unnamed protein product [Rotaria sordida]|uniref:Uncharacterized protein n=1 Tax=Rotaria sordida TaxID=392033 RepID=A0A814FBD5_9BILA|nr:unnamed protein product [Rotaria sordida]CAF3841212.1 unnamed protein product [Rotaria sordida]